MVLCLVMGDGGCGKTKVLVRVLGEEYTDDFETEWAMDATVLKMKVGFVVLGFQDTQGQEEYTCFYDRLIEKADVVMFCFSLTSQQSLERIIRTHEQVLRVKDVQSFPCVLVGCKCDEVMDVSCCAVEVRKEAWNLAIQFGCLYFETSAKKNIGIVSLVPEAVAQSFLKAQPTAVFAYEAVMAFLLCHRRSRSTHGQLGRIVRDVVISIAAMVWESRRNEKVWKVNAG